MLKAAGFPYIDTLYIGGGTPSSLDPAVLGGFLHDLARVLPNTPSEQSIEANPESCTPDFMKIARDWGIDRLSLGLQSLDSRSLAFIGRNNDVDRMEDHLHSIRAAWPGSLSIDLIHDIPGQTAEDIISDLDAVCRIDPDHISHYSLTIEENTPLAARLRQEAAPGMVNKGLPRAGSPDDDRDHPDDALWTELTAFLEHRGYKNYEISNFSKPGHRCRHNLHYWHMDPYFGCGPAAVSTLKGADGSVLRIENPRSCESFSNGRADRWGCTAEPISSRDFLFEHIMMGLRLEEGIDPGHFQAVFGVLLPDLIARSIERWKGDFTVSESRVALTSGGRRILNTILVNILEDLEKIDDLPPPEWPGPPVL